jgi:hypothetical protein|tara:strand:+ start:4343 stop:4540 length:198 start_codon:yes stop_codon:yes gene_type:complete
MTHDRLNRAERKVNARGQLGLFQMDGQQLLSVIDRIMDLTLAMLRSDRLWRDEVNKKTGALDTVS